MSNDYYNYSEDFDEFENFSNLENSEDERKIAEEELYCHVYFKSSHSEEYSIINIYEENEDNKILTSAPNISTSTCKKKKLNRSKKKASFKKPETNSIITEPLRTPCDEDVVVIIPEVQVVLETTDDNACLDYNYNRKKEIEILNDESSLSDLYVQIESEVEKEEDTNEDLYSVDKDRVKLINECYLEVNKENFVIDNKSSSLEQSSMIQSKIQQSSMLCEDLESIEDSFTKEDCNRDHPNQDKSNDIEDCKRQINKKKSILSSEIDEFFDTFQSSDIELSSDSDINDDSDVNENLIINIDEKSENINEADKLLSTILASLPQDSNWSICDQDKNIVSLYRASSSRYFESDRKLACKNCDEKGHFAARCPNPPRRMPCILCGDEGHGFRKCSKILCSKCDQSGHMTRECSEGWPRFKCSRCNLKGHHERLCPDKWRQYHLTTLDECLVKSTTTHNQNKSCYNCSSTEHFGHKCPDVSNYELFPTPISPFIFQYDRLGHQSSGKNQNAHSKQRTETHSKKSSNFHSHNKTIYTSNNHLTSVSNLEHKNNHYNKHDKNKTNHISKSGNSNCSSNNKDNKYFHTGNNVSQNGDLFNKSKNRNKNKFSSIDKLVNSTALRCIQFKNNQTAVSNETKLNDFSNSNKRHFGGYKWNL